MRVSCFTFIRNGTKLKYPFVESIRSALPLCDEFIVAVGDGQDDTRERVLAIGDPRIRIIDTVWNSNMHRQNFVHAQQKMIAHYNCTGDWAFYIEGDEILHEDDVEIVRSAMHRHFDNPKVEALYFDYLHFNGSVEWVGASHSFYRQEVRIIRNALRSFTSGALYFLVLEDKKRGRYPYAAASGARIFHYGNARARTAQFDKMRSRMNTDDNQKFVPPKALYWSDTRVLKRFDGCHPAIMADWIRDHSEHDFWPAVQPTVSRRLFRNILTTRLEALFPLDLSKRHFYRAKV